jgi:hypothetical protein
VETIIAEIAGRFINKLIEIISVGGMLAQIEEGALREAKVCAAQMVGIYAEKVDAEIVVDRTARREAGYRVERRGDERRLQTLVGEVSYRRTYFQKAAGGYEYLADTVLGVEKRERVSAGLSLSLVRAAKELSYAKSSLYLTEGAISRQTVMGKLRQSYSQKPTAGGRRQDPSANNGGCTEPHVSHILSSRLSSRPMVWSKRTLKQLAPILAGGDVCKTPSAAPSLPTPLKKAAVSARKAFRRNTAGLPAPNAIGTLPLSGKVTGTQILLKCFA